MEKAIDTGENEYLSQIYDDMAKKGDRYALLAKGVVEGNTVSGKSALEFMEHSAKSQGLNWSEKYSNEIRRNMAKGYLSTLEKLLHLIMAYLTTTDFSRWLLSIAC